MLGPGIYVTRKRQEKGDKKDLDYLNKGGHLSFGLTKKRQEAYDSRDKRIIKSRMNKNLSNKKKLTKGQKIAIGTAAVAAILGGVFVAKKIHDYKVNENKKYLKYSETVKDIIKKSKTQSIKDAYYTNRSLDRELIRAKNNPYGGKQMIKVFEKGGKLGRSSWGPNWSNNLTSQNFKHQNIQKALDEIEKLNKRYYK